MKPRDRTRGSTRCCEAMACLVLTGALAACASDNDARNATPPEPVVYESRTGVPFLMDLPVIGWLFQHRVTVR